MGNIDILYQSYLLDKKREKAKWNIRSNIAGYSFIACLFIIAYCLTSANKIVNDLAILFGLIAILVVIYITGISNIKVEIQNKEEFTKKKIEELQSEINQKSQEGEFEKLKETLKSLNN